MYVWGWERHQKKIVGDRVSRAPAVVAQAMRVTFSAP